MRRASIEPRFILTKTEVQIDFLEPLSLKKPFQARSHSDLLFKVHSMHQTYSNSVKGKEFDVQTAKKHRPER